MIAVRRGVVRSLVLVVVACSVRGALASPVRADTALAACKDKAYTLNGSHWTGPMRWRFDAASTPKNLRRRAAERALRRAARTVARGTNRCGMSPSLDSRSHYSGRTRSRPNIRKNGNCGSPDGRNEVGFGTLPSGEMALTCYWSRGKATVEADILFNKADFRWITVVPLACVEEWDLRAVATHEFGHAFGLGHVAEGLHANLTMAPYILPCQSSEARLGRGDVRGLRALY